MSDSRQAVGLAFPTPEVGWLAVTGSPVSGEEPTRTEVLRTNDSGVHWRPQWSGTGSPVQFVAVGVQQAFLVLHPNTTCPGASPSQCATRQLATELLSTGDGGRSWKRIWASSAQLSAISFAARGVGLGVIERKPCPDESSSGKAPSCPGDLVRTVDGGRHWSTVLRTPGPLLAVTHEGARTWWAVQSVTSSGGKPLRPMGRLVVWESHDGGISWAERGKIEEPALALLSPRAEAQLRVGRQGQLWLSMVDPESCAMHGCGTVGVWYSDSGGRTWAVTPAMYREAGCGPSGNLPLAVSPGGMAYVATGANLAACSPPAGTLARWDGEGWQKVHTWSFAAVSAISWPSVTTGYVLAGGALARSVDGGRTWSQAWPTVAPLGSLAPLSAEVAIGAGDTIDPGVVLRTTDRGATWRPIADLRGYVTAIDFPTIRDGFAVLLDPVRSTWDLVASDNGGRSWSVRAVLPGRGRGPGAPQGVSGLWMVSPSKGLVLTTSGASEFGLDGVAPATLWSTGNGGRSWDRVGAVPTAPYWGLSAAGFAWSSQDQWWGVVEGSAASPQETIDTRRDVATCTPFPHVERSASGRPACGCRVARKGQWDGLHRADQCRWRSSLAAPGAAASGRQPGCRVDAEPRLRQRPLGLVVRGRFCVDDHRWRRTLEAMTSLSSVFSTPIGASAKMMGLPT